ncbi:MAG TPA: amidohydrolase family protein, partial [Acidimicrobiia bacterium]|nr:amidohydrolase family protein [Acidimicrobiia bacterium]
MTRTLLSNARIFDGTGPDISEGDVVLENGRISDVGTGLDGDESFDLGGKALLPGLFDCHTHVAVSNVDLFAIVQKPFSLHFYEAANNLKATLDAGITTIRDAGGADLGMKRAVETGLISGPHMQVSLVMLSQTGGHGDGWLASGQHLRLFTQHPGLPSNIVDGPDEIRRKVREVVRMGADVIKVATSGGVLSPRDDPRHAHFTLEELQVLVETARALGVWVMAHAQAYDGIKNAVRAGIRSIDHGIYLDDEAIELMLAHGTFLVPTLVAPTGVVKAAEAGMSIPEASLQKAKDVIEIHRGSFARAVAAGVKVAMGTDSGVTPHGDNLDELELMEQGGMAPEDVLLATTRNGAELMGLLDDRGTIEPGKRADLVVLDGNPLEMKGLRSRIQAVFKDGRLASGSV